MEKVKKISLIGAGNVGTALAIALKKAGYDIDTVYSRTLESANILAAKTNARYSTKINLRDDDSELLIISVPDNAIHQMLDMINTDKILVHTSGSLSLDVLKKHSTNIGVLYPLQTFSGRKETSFESIPICIEANNKQNQDMISGIASDISKDVRLIDSTQRKTIHIAAVFASNFSNYMYAVARELLRSSNVDYNILAPLILKTASKNLQGDPFEKQTGPAIRKDLDTIRSHLGSLSEFPDHQEIYEIISQKIIKKKHGDHEKL